MLLNAVMVCVDYSDLLAVTLPFNQHHFHRISVVTSSEDTKTQDLADQLGIDCYITDSFYDDGAIFNKWKALEEALDVFGRQGWMCLMDADILWPKELPSFELEKGNLYCPHRRMFTHKTDPIPEEEEWGIWRIHPNIREWAGYSQIFHAEDEHLPPAPWHDITWKHAGGADSFFQFRWPEENKIRPPFEVLHIGEAGKNWCGRATPYLDGSLPQKGLERLELVDDIWNNREKNRETGDRFKEEKIR
jgi:hypothetical protein